MKVNRDKWGAPMGLCHVCKYYGLDDGEVSLRGIETTLTPNGGKEARIQVCLKHYKRARRLGSPWMTRNRLTADEIKRIRELRDEGWPLSKLAERYEVSETTISLRLRIDPAAGGNDPVSQ